MANENSHSQSMDTRQQRIATVYAKAFLGSARANASELLNELGQFIQGVLNRFPRLEATLASPRLSAEEKKGMLDRLFKSRVSDELLTFLKVLAEHGRLDCLREIHRIAQSQWNVQQGVVEVEFSTAEPIDEQARQGIETALKSKLNSTVRLYHKTNPDLIGGIVVRIGDRVYDASIANRLGQLRQEAVERTVQEMRDAGGRFALAE